MSLKIDRHRFIYFCSNGFVNIYLYCYLFVYAFRILAKNEFQIQFQKREIRHFHLLSLKSHFYGVCWESQPSCTSHILQNTWRRLNSFLRHSNTKFRNNFPSQSCRRIFAKRRRVFNSQNPFAKRIMAKVVDIINKIQGTLHL